MTPDNTRDLIAAARQDAADERKQGVPEKADLLDKLADRLAALTTGQGVDAPSVREAIGEVLADMGAVIEGMPVASDLAALTEITDAAIRAAVSPPSRTAKRTGYETVGHAVGEHSQTIRATAALTTPQEGDARERLAKLLAAQAGEEWDRLVGTAAYARNRFLRKADAILAAFPVLSRDIAGEIEAEAASVRERANSLAVATDHIHARGLDRAAEIVRNGR